MSASEEDLAALRLAALQKALDGDAKGAAGLVAIHDVVSGKAKEKDDKDKKK